MRYRNLLNPAEGTYINMGYNILSVLRIVSLEQRMENSVELFDLSLEDEKVSGMGRGGAWVWRASAH